MMRVRKMTTDQLSKLEKILQKGDIILVHTPFKFYKPSTLISVAIRNITDSHWNHAAMYVGNGKIIEAVLPYVTIVDLNTYQNKDICVLRHKRSNEINLEKLIKDVKSFEGQTYDVYQLFDLAKLFILNKRERSEIYAGKVNRFICSEVAGKPYYNQGFKVKDTITYDKISPGDFATSKHFKKILL